nr:response regulator [candidate division Zixibacteria bacterium]
MNKNLKVLVVDDEPPTADLFSGVLIRSGFQVKSAGNGGDAIEIIKEWRPNIVVCDVVMPGIDGFDVLTFAKKEYPEIRMLMITGQSDPESLRKSFRLGADEFITKPVSSQDLVLIIQRVCWRFFEEKDNSSKASSIA